MTIDDYRPTEFDLFEEKANEILDAFLSSMEGDYRFTRPIDQDEESLAEEYGFLYMYTDRGATLADRMIGRLDQLAIKKFGKEKAFELSIESSLYREP